MNDLRERILKSPFYKEVYENQFSKTINLYVNSIEEGLEEAATLLQCSVHELTYEVLRYKKGFLSKKDYVRYKYMPQEKVVLETVENIDNFTNVENTNKRVIKVDSRYSVRVRKEGVFFRVKPPENNGKEIKDLSLLEKRLNEKEIFTYDSKVAKEVIEKQDGEYRKIADFVEKTPANNSKISCSIKDNGMQVYITLTKPINGGRCVDFEEVMTALTANKIVFGIIDGNIKDAIEEEQYDVPILAASGLYPKNGNNGDIEYLVNVEPKSIPKFIGEEQSVDYKEVSIVENVTEGQKLAVKKDVEKGVNGQNVFGAILEAKDGKDMDIKDFVGDNTELKPDGRTITSLINGQVVLRSKKLCVDPLMEIKGDVGPETGNIKFIGSVVVKGSVLDNYSIEADGNVVIEGTVGRCNITTKSNVMVKLGIHGRETGFVKADKDVIAKFIQFGRVFAGRDIVVTEAILNSYVDANDRIILGGKRASISGGRARAYHEVNGKILGAQSGAKTIIEVGVEPALRNRIDEIIVETETLEREIEELHKQIVALEQLEKYKKLDDEKTQQLEEYRQKFADANEQVDKITTEKESLEIKIQSEDVHATVNAGKEALAGVNIIIRSAELNLRKEYKATTFYEESGMIETKKYQGEAKAVDNDIEDRKRK